MRVFFALPLQEQLKLEIDQWRNDSLPPSQNAVPAANFHITLAFIGQIKDSDIDVLYHRTDQLIKSNTFSKEALKLIDTGFWPKPGILWIGPTDWPDDLTKLAGKLQNVGRNFGAKKAKKSYRPHLTLSKKTHKPSYPIEAPKFELDYNQITLYHSISMKAGVRYTALNSWPLL